MFNLSSDFWEGFLWGVVVTWVILFILVIVKFRPKKVRHAKPSKIEISTVFIPNDEDHRDW